MAHIQVAYEEHYCHVGDVLLHRLIKAPQEAVWCIEIGVLVKWLRYNTTELSGTTKQRQKFWQNIKKNSKDNIKINLQEIYLKNVSLFKLTMIAFSRILWTG